MAKRISDLVAAAGSAGADQIEFSLAGAGGSRSLTMAALRTQLFGGGTGFTATDPIAVGSITIALGTIIAQQTGTQSSVTWNNAAVVFTHETIDVTDTASDTASLLVNWRVGGVSQFSVRKNGNVACSNFFISASIGGFVCGTRSAVKSSSNGTLNVTNNGNSSFTRLTLGLETALFPSLKVNGAALQIRLGDDSGFTTIQGNWQNAADTTGSGSALLGTNCPAVTATAPYTWETRKSSDGSTVYVPCWK